MEPIRATAVCSGCSETKLRIHDVKAARMWRHTDCWNLPTRIRTVLRRVKCRHCGVRIEQVPWAPSLVTLALYDGQRRLVHNRPRNQFNQGRHFRELRFQFPQ